MSLAQQEFLTAALAVFRKQKALGESALRQLDDDQLFHALDPESNSIAVLVKHLHGNMRSRWTDFLTRDGEKQDRHRDEEFLAPGERSRAQVMEWWEHGWRYVFDALHALTPAEVEASVVIRGERTTALAAILRAVDHYAQHVGQVVMLAKHQRGSSWESLSIPRGMSEEFNRQAVARHQH
jgi:Protein of unknown function (DUF1572)